MNDGAAQSPSVFKAVEYRDVPGFPGYHVGDDGTVWTRWERTYPKGRSGAGVRYVIGEVWQLMKTKPGTKSEHREVQLRRDGKSHHCSVHRLVLEAFVGPCPEGMEGCHNDGNPANNQLDNLRWDTPQGNQADRLAHGTDSRGEKHGASAFSDAQVLALFPRLDVWECRAQIARELGVEASVISKIANGQRYRHLRPVGWKPTQKPQMPEAS